MISAPMPVFPATALTPAATVLSASMSSPESVSSSTARLGCSNASWRISMRFFSPPEKPSLRYRVEKSRGTLVSSIAASTVLRKSFSEMGSSRRAFMIIRRYFVTVTPGMATGYWKAMKRPARARSSGSASVISSPSSRIEPSVISRFGWPIRAFARVDLREPLGPIRAWNSPERTCRSTPLRICLSPAETCRFLISRSAMVSEWLFVSVGLAGGEQHQLRQRRALQGLDDAHLHARPEQLGGAGLRVLVMRAEHAAVAVVEEAVHRGDVPLQREDDLVHGDLRLRAGEQVAAVRPAGRFDDAGFLQQRRDPLQVGQ